jgi:LEA14-like dessication related protein
LAVAAFAAAAGLAGCALATATPPSVDVLDVRLTGVGLTEQQLAVTLCVTNPNSSELAFRRVSADLDVSGSPLAAGSSDLAVSLPPLSSTVVPFTVVTTVQNLGPQLLGVFRAGGVDYRVHGTVTLQGSFGLTLPYSRSGHLDPLATGLNLAASAMDPAPSRCGTGHAP